MIWRKGSFELVSVFEGNNFLGIEGLWGMEQTNFSLINVYSPCELGRKKLLWEEIRNLMVVRGVERWCVVGDFYSIKLPTERKEVCSADRSEEMNAFGEFISEAGLIDLPLIGRNYIYLGSI